MKPAVIVNVQRQPGANTIQVADRIKALLPQLKASLPPSVQVSILTDRTETIRASVSDIQFELMLTIGLVVMVMFLFLRNLSATIIPSIAVPLSLVGAFGIMYLMGFSLNNLTLMALTISTGFVVDDAIVMIENITRYIEKGDSPLEAALKGSEQIGFTILSLTVSLIAVLIPLLFMGDIIGRLFREFAITLSVTILVSAVVSLTLTPMMCSRLLRHRKHSEQNALFRASERGFEAIVAAYGSTLRWVLRHQTLTLFVTVGTLAGTLLLYVVVPKGFFPVQDTGAILGVSEAAQSISFSAMADRQQALAHVILQDPDVESLSSFIGVDGTNTTINSGRLQINLKPLEQRKSSASDIIRRLQPQIAKVQGITLFMQPVQDLSVDDRISRTQYQYSLEDAERRRTQSLGAEAGRKAAHAAGASRCRQRSAGSGTADVGHHRSRHRGTIRHHAADDRRHAVRRVRPAAGFDHVHAAESVSRRDRSGAAVPEESGFAESDLCPIAQRHAGSAESDLQG